MTRCHVPIKSIRDDRLFLWEVSSVRRRRFRQWSDRYRPPAVRVWVSSDAAVLLWTARCGHVFSGSVLHFVHSDGDGQRSELWARIHEGPMKRKDRGSCPGLSQHASDKGISDTHPSLAEFMTAASFDGNSERRQAPTVTVWCTSGEWRASVKDRAEGLVMWLTAPTWAELWQMIDLMCLEDSGPWRHDEDSHERNGKRVKK